MKKTDLQPLWADLTAFHKGEEYEAYKLFGAHPAQQGGEEGFVFRLWAPRAQAVSLVGDFNAWQAGATPMETVGEGIWQCFVAGLAQYDAYQYAITGADGQTLYHIDPYAVHAETRPGKASKLYRLAGYRWKDGPWRRAAAKADPGALPMNIYELHAGSWRTYPDGNPLNYRDLADQLIPYILKMGYTHVEFMPLSEYPFDGSWGYQVSGYYAPTSRYGTPHDLMAMVDKFHQAGIGVLMDWVPAHFPKDAFALARLDGSPCYEDPNPARGEHKEWGTLVFDYGRPEVQSFLVSNALYWLKEFHVDGLRVDAVASMLYLDYNRQEGQWQPNIHGGNENLEAVAFLQKLNTAVARQCPGAVMVAEESTAWPGVTAPVAEGGLGFHFKWNMGWMNDSLQYISTDPLFRKGAHGKLTFSFHYAFSERYILPLSHDEVVHGKASMVGKMPGDYNQKFSGLRAFYGYMMAHPGKKLHFMGNEFAQFIEWNYAQELDWMLLSYDAHQRMQQFVAALNGFYKAHPALWQWDCDRRGLVELVLDDDSQNILIFARRAADGSGVLSVSNFSPVERQGYCVGVPEPGSYKEVFNTSAEVFGGSGAGNKRALRTRKGKMHGQAQHICMTIPGHATLYFTMPPHKEEE